MDKKTEYLLRELWVLTWNASVQHAALYKKDAYKNQTDLIDTFKDKIIDHVKTKVLPQYSVNVEEQQHCANIKDLISYANMIDTGILGEKKYKYGVAQKVLNLALKYYWCLGLIEEPPHCPIDKRIIDKTSYKGRINWTQILTESEYINVISDIRQLAEQEKCSIAQWELYNWLAKPYVPIEDLSEQKSLINGSTIINDIQFDNQSLENRKRQLADKYIKDPQQKEIFLTKATQYKMWANYIAGLILTNKGHKEFHVKDVRRVLEQKLGELYNGPGARESGLLTGCMADTSIFNGGYPCLQKVDERRGYYKFIGFPCKNKMDN